MHDAAQGQLRSSAGNSLTLDEQARRWTALLDVEGKGCSGRPVLVQDRPWREWFWDCLVPMEHCVPVRRDLSDLVSQARWVQQHPQEAADIGRAGQKLAQQLLTRRAAVEQWARILTDAPPQPAHDWAPVALQERLQPVLRRLGASGQVGATLLD